MSKYVANAMLATKISFINEMANLCERLGADINDVRRGIGHDARIGFQFLFPGAGFGGSCFPKDIRAMISMARCLDMPIHVMEAVERVNEAQKHVLVHKIRRHYGSALRRKPWPSGVWRSSRSTDDIREAPALTLIESLLADGVKLRVHDPEALANVRELFGDRLVYCDRPYGALEGADGLAIVTEWQEFRNPDFELMRGYCGKRPFSTGELHEPKALAALGFKHYPIGR